MIFLGFILIVIASYLFGSLPTGYLVGKTRGVDLLKSGSGNIGATNTFRVLGKPAGTFVLLCDILKGFLAVMLVPGLAAKIAPEIASSETASDLARVVAAFTAILGHNYTCWLRFKGGKGIATTAGVMTALAPWALLITVTVWIIVTFSTRYVSLGSLAAAVTLPIATGLVQRNLIITSVAALMGGLAIYKHRTNIQRLIAGTENRIGEKKQKGAAE